MAESSNTEQTVPSWRGQAAGTHRLSHRPRHSGDSFGTRSALKDTRAITVGTVRDVPPILSQSFPGDRAVALDPGVVLGSGHSCAGQSPCRALACALRTLQCWVASSVQGRTGRCPQASASLGAVLQWPGHLSALLVFAGVAPDASASV